MFEWSRDSFSSINKKNILESSANNKLRRTVAKRPPKGELDILRECNTDVVFDCLRNALLPISNLLQTYCSFVQNLENLYKTWINFTHNHSCNLNCILVHDPTRSKLQYTRYRLTNTHI